MKEIYVDVKGFEGLYKVSNTGRVVSSPKTGGNGNKVRELKQEETKNKKATYRRVSLSKQGVVKRFLVHRLVALHFIENPLNKPQVNHIDNDGSNNNVDNLEWVTGSENMQHSVKQGRQKAAQAAGTEAARKTIYIRYAKLYQDRLGDRFLAYYASDLIKFKKEKTKRCACVEYLCRGCGQARKAQTDWNELRVHDGLCPNCQQIVELLDEDIV